MYRIPETDRQTLDTYFSAYEDRVRELMEWFLNGGTLLRTATVNQQNVPVTIRVEPDSHTHSLTRDWLRRCTQDPEERRRLITGDYDEQRKLIAEVLADSPAHFKAFSSSKHKKYLDSHQPPYEVDDFNEIMHHIFVEHLFEGNDSEPHPLDKHALLDGKALRVCPYCGDTYIYTHQRINQKNGISICRPQPDHFLPKRKYPFLAINYYNLIPCCTECNEAPNKLAGDPLGDDKTHEFLMQPYRFDPERFHFQYEYLGTDYYQDENFQVGIDYHGNADTEYGFTHLMTTQSKYEGHRGEVKDMYLHFMDLTEQAVEMYERMGIPQEYWTKERVQRAVAGFSLTPPNDQKRTLFKFKKDLFNQMLPLFQDNQRNPLLAHTKTPDTK